MTKIIINGKSVQPGKFAHAITRLVGDRAAARVHERLATIRQPPAGELPIDVVCGDEPGNLLSLTIVDSKGAPHKGEHYIYGPCRCEPGFGVTGVNFDCADLLVCVEPSR